MATATLGALSLAGMSGCDTLAQITFDDRSFEVLEVVGLTPDAGSCKGSSGQALMRFVMVDGANLPISDKTVIANEDVSLATGDLSLESPIYFEYPGLECSGSEDCATDGFACDVAPDLETDLCQLSAGSASPMGSARFAVDTEKTQVFAVMVENTASISGRLPTDLQRLSPDYRGGADGGPDGVADDVNGNSAYSGSSPSRATDRNNTRKAAVSSMASPWENVAAHAKSDNQVRTFFGSWLFGGSSTDLISTTGEGSAFVEDPTQVRAALATLNDAGDDDAVASVYESMLTVIEGGEALNSFASDGSVEKSLVVVVDGPDDLRQNASSAARVIEAAKAVGVRVFIVHLDPAVEQVLDSGVPLLPDLPGYAVAQQGPCLDLDEDGDPVAGAQAEACKNFEECRRVTGYATQAGRAVVQPSGRLEDAYCAIKRDDEGRIGPIDEYAEIACATGGGYMYFPDTEFLSNKIGFLPYVLDGMWEVDLSLDAYARDAMQAGEPYAVDTTVQVTVGGNQRSKRLSQDSNFDDERRVLFKAPAE